MDIKELDKKQLILLTLLITFVVSLATGIVTVSLMNQMPKNVPQTINNVIQRTIEKVTTVQAPATEITTPATEVKTSSPTTVLGNSESLVSIYLKNGLNSENQATEKTDGVSSSETSAIGQGIIISDMGLILVDGALIKETESYKVVLNKTDFDVAVLKKYDNGFSILKISPTKEMVDPSGATTQNQ